MNSDRGVKKLTTDDIRELKLKNINETRFTTRGGARNHSSIETDYNDLYFTFYTNKSGAGKLRDIHKLSTKICGNETKNSFTTYDNGCGSYTFYLPTVTSTDAEIEVKNRKRAERKAEAENSRKRVSQYESEILEARERVAMRDRVAPRDITEVKLAAMTEDREEQKARADRRLDRLMESRTRVRAMSESEAGNMDFTPLGASAGSGAQTGSETPTNSLPGIPMMTPRALSEAYSETHSEDELSAWIAKQAEQPYARRAEQPYARSEVSETYSEDMEPDSPYLKVIKEVLDPTVYEAYFLPKLKDHIKTSQRLCVVSDKQYKKHLDLVKQAVNAGVSSTELSEFFKEPTDQDITAAELSIDVASYVEEEFERGTYNKTIRDILKIDDREEKERILQNQVDKIDMALKCSTIQESEGEEETVEEEQFRERVIEGSRLLLAGNIKTNVRDPEAPYYDYVLGKKAFKGRMLDYLVANAPRDRGFLDVERYMGQQGGHMEKCILFDLGYKGDLDKVKQKYIKYIGRFISSIKVDSRKSTVKLPRSGTQSEHYKLKTSNGVFSSKFKVNVYKLERKLTDTLREDSGRNFANRRNARESFYEDSYEDLFAQQTADLNKLFKVAKTSEEAINKYLGKLAILKENRHIIMTDREAREEFGTESRRNRASEYMMEDVPTGFVDDSSELSYPSDISVREDMDQTVVQPAGSFAAGRNMRDVVSPMGLGGSPLFQRKLEVVVEGSEDSQSQRSEFAIGRNMEDVTSPMGLGGSPLFQRKLEVATEGSEDSQSQQSEFEDSARQLTEFNEGRKQLIKKVNRCLFLHDSLTNGDCAGARRDRLLENYYREIEEFNRDVEVLGMTNLDRELVNIERDRWNSKLEEFTPPRGSLSQMCYNFATMATIEAEIRSIEQDRRDANDAAQRAYMAERQGGAEPMKAGSLGAGLGVFAGLLSRNPEVENYRYGVTAEQGLEDIEILEGEEGEEGIEAGNAGNTGNVNPQGGQREYAAPRRVSMTEDTATKVPFTDKEYGYAELGPNLENISIKESQESRTEEKTAVSEGYFAPESEYASIPSVAVPQSGYIESRRQSQTSETESMIRRNTVVTDKPYASWNEAIEVDGGYEFQKLTQEVRDLPTGRAFNTGRMEKIAEKSHFIPDSITPPVKSRAYESNTTKLDKPLEIEESLASIYQTIDKTRDGKAPVFSQSAQERFKKAEEVPPPLPYRETNAPSRTLERSQSVKVVDTTIEKAPISKAMDKASLGREIARKEAVERSEHTTKKHTVLGRVLSTVRGKSNSEDRYSKEKIEQAREASSRKEAEKAERKEVKRNQKSERKAERMLDWGLSRATETAPGESYQERRERKKEEERQNKEQARVEKQERKAEKISSYEPSKAKAESTKSESYREKHERRREEERQNKEQAKINKEERKREKADLRERRREGKVCTRKDIIKQSPAMKRRTEERPKSEVISRAKYSSESKRVAELREPTRESGKPPKQDTKHAKVAVIPTIRPEDITAMQKAERNEKLIEELRRQVSDSQGLQSYRSELRNREREAMKNQRIQLEEKRELDSLMAHRESIQKDLSNSLQAINQKMETAHNSYVEQLKSNKNEVKEVFQSSCEVVKDKTLFLMEDRRDRHRHNASISGQYMGNRGAEDSIARFEREEKALSELFKIDVPTDPLPKMESEPLPPSVFQVRSENMHNELTRKQYDFKESKAVSSMLDEISMGNSELPVLSSIGHHSAKSGQEKPSTSKESAYEKLRTTTPSTERPSSKGKSFSSGLSTLKEEGDSRVKSTSEKSTKETLKSSKQKKSSKSKEMSSSSVQR